MDKPILYHLSKKVGVLLLFSICFCFNASAIHISKAKELPKTAEFESETEDGQTFHVNLGVMVDDQFSFLGVPLWNEGEPKYVLYNERIAKTSKGDFTWYQYVELDNDDVTALREEVGGIPAKPQLSFWERIGGKLVALVVLVVLIFLFALNKKVTETATTDETQLDATGDEEAPNTTDSDSQQAEEETITIKNNEDDE